MTNILDVDPAKNSCTSLPEPMCSPREEINDSESEDDFDNEDLFKNNETTDKPNDDEKKADTLTTLDNNREYISIESDEEVEVEEVEEMEDLVGPLQIPDFAESVGTGMITMKRPRDLDCKDEHRPKYFKRGNRIDISIPFSTNTLENPHVLEALRNGAASVIETMKVVEEKEKLEYELKNRSDKEMENLKEKDWTIVDLENKLSDVATDYESRIAVLEKMLAESERALSMETKDKLRFREKLSQIYLDFGKGIKEIM